MVRLGMLPRSSPHLSFNQIPPPPRATFNEDSFFLASRPALCSSVAHHLQGQNTPLTGCHGNASHALLSLSRSLSVLQWERLYPLTPPLASLLLTDSSGSPCCSSFPNSQLTQDPVHFASHGRCSFCCVCVGGKKNKKTTKLFSDGKF